MTQTPDDQEHEGHIMTEGELIWMYKQGMVTNLGFAAFALELHHEDNTPMLAPTQLKDYCLRHGMKERTYYEVVKKLKEQGRL